MSVGRKRRFGTEGVGSSIATWSGPEAPVVVAREVRRETGMEGVALREVAFEPLRNYLWALTGDPRFDLLFGGTLWHALISTFVIHVTAIPLAAFVNQAFRRTRAGVLALYFLPFPLLGSLSRVPDVRIVGKFAAAIVSLYYFIAGILLLAGGVLL